MPLPAANSQALAANLIVRVVCDKKPLKSNKKNNKLVQALCYGCLRWLPKLEAMANYFIQKPLKEKDFDIKVLIFIGLYQLEFLRMPDHAAVFETAKAAECLGKPWAKNFINAILRHYLRNKAAVEEKIKQIPSAFYAHPTWLLTALQKNWPLYWSDIVRCNNERAPMTLRVNIRQLSLEHYVIKLREANIASSLCQHTPAAILLDVPCEVSSLPGYLEGEFSVQDCAAQLAAPLLRLLPGQRILDACAAPGGKTTHILETEPGLSEVLAIDNKAVRLNKVQENLIRLKLQASVIHGDAADPEAWWDGRYFDRILLDVPCSATGTIRRHPDIKIIRGPQDPVIQAEQQFKLLTALWPLLKPGGLLLYVSCSIFPEENTALLESFLKIQPDAFEDIIDASWGISQKVGRQILPCYEMDGFFYARLCKKLSAS